MTENFATITGHFTHHCREDVEICIVTCNISFPSETIVSTVERVQYTKSCPEKDDVLFFCMLCDSSSSFKDCTKNSLSVVLCCHKASMTHFFFFFLIVALHLTRS